MDLTKPLQRLQTPSKRITAGTAAETPVLVESGLASLTFINRRSPISIVANHAHLRPFGKSSPRCPTRNNSRLTEKVGTRVHAKTRTCEGHESGRLAEHSGGAKTTIG